MYHYASDNTVNKIDRCLLFQYARNSSSVFPCCSILFVCKRISSFTKLYLNNCFEITSRNSGQQSNQSWNEFFVSYWYFLRDPKLFAQTLISWPIWETIHVTNKSSKEEWEEENEEDIFSLDSTWKRDITTSLCIKGANSLRSSKDGLFSFVCVGEDQLTRHYFLLIKHYIKTYEN